MKPKISDSELLMKLSAAVSYLYPNDKSCPSVLISTLKDGKVYTSIVRYGDFNLVDYSGVKEKSVKGKLVICNATANSLRESLLRLVNNFFFYINNNKPKLNPLEELVSLFKPSNLSEGINCFGGASFEEILGEAFEASYNGQ
jgi:hypothetical protein